MAKKWKYHKSHSFVVVEGNHKVSMISQLYQVGVYAIVNSDPALQSNNSPNMMVTRERKLKKAESEGIIKDLEFGMPITVIEENSMYVEYNEMLDRKNELDQASMETTQNLEQ